jgi:signal transduction histidine kinase
MTGQAVASDLIYASVLFEYCRSHSEESLYNASLLSAGFIQEGLGPDEIVALHFDAVQQVAGDESFTPSDRVRVLNDAHQFLLEVMIGYGAQYKEYLDLKLDAAVRRAETAERSEKEKLEILAMIAHELGNPITIALGNMQIASRFLDAEDMTNVRSLVSDSREALDRLAILTRQIVSASQNEEPEVDLELLHIRASLERVSGWAENACVEKGLAFEIDPGEGDDRVIGNTEAMNSILTNLISNGIRYTPSGGKISVTCLCNHEEVSVSVRDTGIGISQEDQIRIFDKFFRSTGAKRMESAGLGMGLAITSKLVRAQNGRIEVWSHPNQGSTFTVRFPAYGKED